MNRTLLKLFNRSWRYRLKENYITAHASIEWWEGHINYMLLQQYGAYLTGEVIDFGCNHGACTILAARNAGLAHITGVDFNKEALGEAGRLLQTCNEKPEVKHKVTFREASLFELPFADDSFDNGYMFHVIEHIYPADQKKVFGEMRRVIKPGGFILFALPYEHAYDDGVQHVAFFNVDSFRKTLNDFGFEVKECYRDQRPDRHTPNGHDCINAMCSNKK
ncbi:MAG: class I SAM-dependent methyltransferase [Chitinophagales bacterium]|nr:class I SAM-dependent methyltransferase [Chitinophagales bacterium]